MSKLRVRILLAAMAFGAAVVSGPVAVANATPMSYLQALNEIGLQVYDTQAAVTYGYAICSELNTAPGDVVATRIFATTSWAAVPNIYVAGAMMVAAVENLCPWHDHRGRQVA